MWKYFQQGYIPLLLPAFSLWQRWSLAALHRLLGSQKNYSQVLLHTSLVPAIYEPNWTSEAHITLSGYMRGMSRRPFL